MNARAQVLAARRASLLLRSQQLRLQAEQQSAGLSPAFALADRLQDGWGWLRAHPEVVAGAALGVAALRPRKAFRLGLRVWSLWRLARRWRFVGQALQRYF
ncbi:MAG: YqjK family protein [Hydrogenophaga sp.]